MSTLLELEPLVTALVTASATGLVTFNWEAAGEVAAEVAGTDEFPALVVLLVNAMVAAEPPGVTVMVLVLVDTEPSDPVTVSVFTIVLYTVDVGV